MKVLGEALRRALGGRRILPRSGYRSYPRASALGDASKCAALKVPADGSAPRVTC
jgi:hypothetical protein